jgi:hypothetical protein
MVNIQECNIARDFIVSRLKDELLGPGSENSLPDREHEIITDYPEVRYSVGVLYPQKNIMAADNDEVSTSGESEDNDEVDDEQDENNTVLSNDDRYEGNIADDLQDDTLDEAVALSTQYRPSSMGMTFFVDRDVNYIKINISFATYRKNEWKDCLIPYGGTMTADDISNSSAGMYIKLEDGFLKLNCPFTRKDAHLIDNTDKVPDRGFIDAIYKLASQSGSKGFKRIPHEAIVEINFTESTSFEEIGLDSVDFAKLVAVKNYTEHGLISITVMLMNNNEGDYLGTNSIFQPSITINTVVNPHFHFVSYANRIISEEDKEELSLALLYMNKQQYASGHGTSVKWSINEMGLGEISTDILPISIVPQMDFEYAFKNGKVDKKSLSMKFLSDLDDTDKQVKLNAINQLINTYEEWINDICGKAKQLNDKYKTAAEDHIKQCFEVLNRMKNGLELLESDGDIYNVFQLTNRAMFMQLIHRRMQDDYKVDVYPGDKNVQNKLLNLDYRQEDNQLSKCIWRPFQMAFLLINLNSLSNSEHKERDLVDLIWFPTGGGKTEAYLGLTAFSIFYRRLKHLPESGGTTVIMRYTLRLLASQQFSRASTLICACEYIRLDCNLRRSKYPHYNLGKEPITIGLWIGGDHTPNKNCGNDQYMGAREFFDKLNNAEVNSLKDQKDKFNKFQVLKCPWCGTKMVKDESGRHMIGDWGYRMRDNRHFYLRCPQTGCEFQGSLPIQVVDEELYANPPTLLFGTVDKFAMIAWKEEVGHFFASNSKNRTPELIIQDELHLISGPLGSMVGLYETAIDALCCAKGIRPKIIASTATIRRAKDQCFNLYNRPVRQFPSPGLDASDSFFAKDADPNEKPGRLYLGIMPFGKTKAMMQVISIATLLQYVSMLQFADEVKDQYWTLTTYFNSLRDLGKCSGLVDDDIKDFMKRLVRRIATEEIIRHIATADELTSRVSTTRLNETLEKLERIVYSKENVSKKVYASDVLLATNMISVGVDVARLNLMIVVGQPKLTSEYIQASSRIGRTNPGIVCTLYDATKSRDRSHYEQFYPYHESFYRHVEPTSVTPFSKPARERAVHAVIIGLLRHILGLSHDADAQYFDKNADYIKKIETYLINRLQSIRSNMEIQLADESDELLSEIKSFWDDWSHMMESVPADSFYYGERFIFARPGPNQRRLIKPFASGTFDVALETLTSMRNVDRSVASHILLWEEDLK